MPKYRIEESSARRQAKIDSGAETIVGVNKYRLEKEDPINILKINNEEVLIKQQNRINKMKETRDSAKVQQCLDALTESAKSGQGNLLELAVTAAAHRATVGEISYALEKVYGRHVAKDTVVKGAYRKMSESSGDAAKAEFDGVQSAIQKFSQ